MKLHSQAWNGIKIVILGNKPIQPMQIEQTLVTSSPFSEVQISSFENYDDAYKFCKTNKDVGFIILSEESGNAPFQSVFRELSKPYETQGIPCFGVIYYQNSPNPFYAFTIGKHDKLIDYCSVSSLLDTETSRVKFEEFWDKYVDAFQNLVLPKSTQLLLIAHAQKKIGPQNLHFQMRLVNNLSEHSNLSWIETLALKWSPILHAVFQNDKDLINNQPTLDLFLEMTEISALSSKDIIDVMKSSDSLLKKLFFLNCHLTKCLNQGSIENELDRLSSFAKPGAPFLIRHIHSNKGQILNFSKDALALIGKTG